MAYFQDKEILSPFTQNGEGAFLHRKFLVGGLDG
jgi:hypothetical protein